MHRSELQAILDALVLKGCSLPEKRYKRLPKGFDASMPFVELAQYDCMYVYTEVVAKLLTEKRVIDELYTHFEAMLALQGGYLK